MDGDVVQPQVGGSHRIKGRGLAMSAHLVPRMGSVQSRPANRLKFLDGKRIILPCGIQRNLGFQNRIFQKVLRAANKLDPNRSTPFRRKEQRIRSGQVPINAFHIGMGPVRAPIETDHRLSARNIGQVDVQRIAADFIGEDTMPRQVSRGIVQRIRFESSPPAAFPIKAVQQRIRGIPIRKILDGNPPVGFTEQMPIAIFRKRRFSRKSRFRRRRRPDSPCLFPENGARVPHGFSKWIRLVRTGHTPNLCHAH